MKLKRIVLTMVAAMALTSCGGGGGGGGGTTNAQTPVQAANTNSYSYQKLSTAQVGDNLDFVSRALVYRDNPNGGVSFISGGVTMSQFKVALVENLEGQVGNRFTVNKTFFDANGDRFEPDFDLAWTIEFFDEPFSIGNALEEVLYWWSQDGTFNDMNAITQTDYTALNFGYWIDNDLLARYLETEYVVPTLISVDYGDNCFLSSFGCDEDFGEDLIASVGGDFTAPGDMPTTGVAYMDGRGIALYHTNDVGYASGAVRHYLAAESDGEIDVDYSGKTISGYLTFDAVFSKKTPGLSWPRREGESAGGFQLDGVIVGNTASGTVTWGGEAYGSGRFSGAFFGPDGKEFGGVITARDDLEDEFSQIIAAFVAEIE